jgi:hypothetical protein
MESRLATELRDKKFSHGKHGRTRKEKNGDVFSLARTGTDFGRAGPSPLGEASALSILNF